MDSFDLGDGFEVRRLKVADVKEQDTNAHTMPSRVFERLSENIGERGGLESLPLVAHPDPEGPYEVVSGHHRLRAAEAAGVGEAWCLVDTQLRTRSSIVAKQLAHNALVGIDDPQLVQELLKQIDNPDDMLRTGLPPEQLPNIGGDTLNLFTPHLDFQWKNITFTFLPHQMRNFDQLLDSIKDRRDLLGAAQEEQFEEFIKAVAAYARFKDIRSVGTAIAMLTEAALAALPDEEDEG
jgi:hypothetical protein